jgi:hypothetical protein
MKSFSIRKKIDVVLLILIITSMGSITSVLSQVNTINMEKEASSLVTVSIPLEGLDANEKCCLEIVKNIYTLIQLEKDPIIIQKKIKPILVPLWGDLSTTGLILRYNFAGIKDEDLITSIHIETPDRKSILFLFNNKKEFPPKYVTVSNFNSSDTNVKIIGFAFFDTGFLSDLWYANQQREVVKKITKWDEKGKFISSESLQKPIPLNFKIEK